ncbi:hypothetical protein ACJRO7_022787 [Eucalyptus globulus]|uniref:Uncharacterized protein n=1 Tax=Eucalyptus globulus TaxID=34317 RepID=A0ABD3K439_EUCGL
MAEVPPPPPPPPPPSLPLSLISFDLWNDVASSPLSVPDGVVPSAHLDVHHRPCGLRFPNCPPSYGSDSDSDAQKSLNQKKREARCDVPWGMELASFSHPQIKRFLRWCWEIKIVASLEQAALDAWILAKRLKPDVREGKRSQFNYIGRLLQEVEPELMDASIEATEDGDQSRLRALLVLEGWEYREHSSIPSWWFDGLISKDIQMADEVFSIHTIDFDQQPRKLVWSVQLTQEQRTKNKREASMALLREEKSSTHFLRKPARQLCGSNT